MVHLLDVSLAALEVIEKHPSVLLLYPPEFSPELVPLRTRTISWAISLPFTEGDTFGYGSVGSNLCAYLYQGIAENGP
jgi:hypothetical protein